MAKSTSGSASNSFDAREAAKKIIEGSGNSFHAQVAQWFQKNGWQVRISPYYMDQSQGKAREIDLIAERFTEIKMHHGQHLGDIVVRLFVECKYVSSHSVFWFAAKDRHEANRLVWREGYFRERNSYTEKHHYLSSCPTVAKVFATEAKTQEQEPIYKAVNQVLNAFVSMENSPLFNPELENRRGMRIVLNYPIVVCSDFTRLFQTDFFKNSEPEPITDNFQLEVQYAYTDRGNNPQERHFLIDYVEFSQLQAICEQIGQDANIAAYLVSDDDL